MFDYNEVPAQLINFEVYASGNRFLGIASLDLSELKNKTYTLSGAGIAGEIEMPTIGFFESFTSTFNWHNITQEGFMFLRQRGTDFIVYGAAEMYSISDGQIKPRQIKVEMRTLPKNMNLGSFKPAESTETKTEVEVVYIKITVGGYVVAEIDKFNYKCVINGVDYLSDVRTALNRG